MVWLKGTWTNGKREMLVNSWIVIFYFMRNICTFCEGDGDFYFLGRG